MYVNGGLIPVFLLYKGLGLTNSFWVYVVPGMVSAFNMLVIRTYMNGIPDSLEESAQLDGAGYTTIFLKIYSLSCKPVYATVALFVAVGQWNSWFDAMLYNRMSTKLTTLQYELMKLLSAVTNQGGSAETLKKCCRRSYTYLSSCRSNNYNNASDHMYLPVFTEILCYRTYTWWS